MALALAGCAAPHAADPSALVGRLERALPAPDRTAFRLARLKGYFLAAGRQSSPAAASALAGQGMLEAYDGEPGAFSGLGLDEGVLRDAAADGDPDDIAKAVSALSAAEVKAGGDPRPVARALVRLASGLYDSVRNGAGIDPVEYQHSLAAVLAAQDLVDTSAAAASGKIATGQLAALWPGPAAASPAPAARIDAAAVRALAALS